MVVPAYTRLLPHLHCSFFQPQPRRGPTPSFARADFDALKNSFDYFSLMTYDFSGQRLASMSDGPFESDFSDRQCVLNRYHIMRYRAGPNAPLKWMAEAVSDLVPSDSDVYRHKVDALFVALYLCTFCLP